MSRDAERLWQRISHLKRDDDIVRLNSFDAAFFVSDRSERITQGAKTLKRDFPS